MPTPIETPHVRTLDDAARWAEHCIAAVTRTYQVSLNHLAQAASQHTFSTAFSGIGAPDVAGQSLSHSLAFFAELSSAPQLVCTFGFEMRDESRHELSMLESAPQCLFGDITDLIADRYRQILKDHSNKMTSDDLAKTVLAKHVIHNRAWCYRHGCYCKPKAARTH